MSSLAIINLGLILSGDLAKPLLEGDCLVAEEGKINRVGTASQLNPHDADTVIDAAVSAVMPGIGCSPAA